MFLLRKILAILTVIYLLFTTTVFATVNADEVIKTEFNNETGMMKIYGTLPDDAKDVWVTVRVFEAGTENLVNLRQVMADKDKKYETTMAFNVNFSHNSGDDLYDIKVNYYGSTAPVENSAPYTLDEYTLLWKNISEAVSTEAVKGYLDNEGADAKDMDIVCAKLGISNPNTDLDRLSGHIFDKVSADRPQSVDEAQNCMREALIFTAIEEGGSQKALDYIAANDSVIKNILTVNTESTVYTLYNSSSENVKSAFKTNFGGYFADGAEFEKSFGFTLMLETLKNSDSYTQITTVLDNLGQLVLDTFYVGSVYTTLENTSDKQAFAKILEEKCTAVTTLLEFKTAYTNACTDYISNPPSVPTIPSTPSTPSGGGGGGGFVSFTEKTEEKNVEEESKKSQNALITDMFIDLDSVPWAKESINALYKKGIVSGKNEFEFFPQDNITREEFVKLLVLSLGLDCSGVVCEFEDVKENDWFYLFVSRAYSDGLVNGVNEVFFGTGSNITREDMAVMVYRALEKSELLTDAESVEEFSDAASIAEYAKTAAHKLSAMGIINGVGNKTFAPKANATRAEAAKIIYAVNNLKY